MSIITLKEQQKFAQGLVRIVLQYSHKIKQIEFLLFIGIWSSNWYQQYVPFIKDIACAPNPWFVAPK